ncbi:MAG: hypothetical protein JXB88_07350 [Spirochaetales bacterium]|nr:hypothetical protein [Spirochaetales bacterium]
MKNIIIIGILLTVWIGICCADVIPEGHHIVSRGVIIANCNDYPDYTLVGYITGPMIDDYELLVVKQDVAINKGYKFNTFRLYAIRQEVIQAMGGVEYIDYSYLIDIIPPVSIINPAAFTIEDANPLSSETIIYTIYGIENGKLVLYISERRLGFNDGSSPVIEYYTYTP